MSLLKLLAAAASQPAGIHYVGGYVAGYTGTVHDISIPLTSLTGGLASAPAKDDLVIVAVVINKSVATDLTVNGYTEIIELTADNAIALDDTHLGVFIKFMGSTPDTTATLVGGTTNSARAGAAYVSVWRGVNQTTPMDVTANTAIKTRSVLADPPSITPITPGAYIVAIGAGAHTATERTYSSSNLTAFLSAGKDNYKGDVTIGGGYKEWTSGAFNPAQFNFSGSDSTYYSSAAVTLALRPA